MLVYGGADTPAYVIDDDTLREVLLDEDEAAEYVDDVGDDPLAVAYLRMLGQLDAATDLGERVLADREEGTASWAAAAVRLAHVHHWAGRYAAAHDLLDRAAGCVAGDPAMEAFVQQHRAKVLLDEGRSAEALAEASGALELRRGLGDTSLIAASEQVVTAVLRDLGGDTPGAS